jgi:hypothetical protein
MEGVVYKITYPNFPSYIGSTFHLRKRVHCHKNNKNSTTSKKIYDQAKQDGKLEDVQVKILDTINFSKEITLLDASKILRKKECEYFKLNRGEILNVNRPYVSPDESHYKFYIKNKYTECICGKKYTLDHRSRHFKSITHQKYLLSLPINT